MKKITKNTLPTKLTEEVIEILVEMALEDPKQTFDWAEVSELLEQRGQLREVLMKVRAAKKSIEQAKENAKSEEQKHKEKKEWKKYVKNVDPKKFFGNMGEPTTPKEYKDKYGVWPPGYDKNGNKL